MHLCRLIIITGSSRGIGAELVTQASKLYDNTVFLLISRSMSSQASNQQQILAIERNNNRFLRLQIDFSKHQQTSVDNLYNVIQRCLMQLQLKDENDFKELLVFYNHGTLKLESVENVADSASEEFQTNVVSVWTLLAAIRRLFPLERIRRQIHVNISSLLATQVKESFSIYNSTRSARATLFKCLALEQPSLRVLNYQPGPVYTDMQKQIYENVPPDDNYTKDYDEGKLLKPEQTVRRLLNLIRRDEFENGAAIDYYDLDESYDDNKEK